MQEYLNKLRNFSIIAHIDHGKSTLADRLLEHTGSIEKREMKDRILDTLDLEQERGITIKLQTARMFHTYSGDDSKYTGEQFVLNLIDTPGHVDFSYEVSRSLASSEAAILLVDATQGIQAQTLTTVYKALENELEIIPVINKVDLPSAEVPRITEELTKTFGFTKEEIILTSAKTGLGVENLLNAVIERCPAPTPTTTEENTSLDEIPPKLLIYDSFYHEHKGVVVLVKVANGIVNKKDKLYSIGTEQEIEPIEIGFMTPNMIVQDKLREGEVGYIATGLKDIKALHVGDTITNLENKDNGVESLPGYQPPKPMVYATLFPVDANDFEEFSDAIEKLSLNDSALIYKRENSAALGSGFVCGFLGLLHLEITVERLEQEFNLNLISTSPTVDYKVWLTTKDMSKIPSLNVAYKNDDESFNIRTAAEFPDRSLVERVEEPWVKLEILTPEKYIGSLMELSQKHRGTYIKMEYISADNAIQGQKHVILKYEIPTAQIITSFFDKLKSISQGYASMDYEFMEYRQGDISKVSVLINGEPAEALSFLCHTTNAVDQGKSLASKLKELIPRQNFKVPIQAAIGGKIIARETIDAYRKDVTAKLYGGDVSRKKKLLQKQKKGKKRLKMFGNVEIPKEAFLGALKMD